MKYLKKYNPFIKYHIYEGKSGFPDVDKAFDDWIRYSGNLNQVLIGGMAFLNYLPGRTTTDVDFIFLSETELPSNVNKFKHIRKHGFRHITTHVEIETLTPEFLNIDSGLLKLVFDTAHEKDSYKIASPSSIVALKLDRLDIKDIDDIKNLYENFNIDIEIYKKYLSDKAIENIKYLKENYNIEL